MEGGLHLWEDRSGKESYCKAMRHVFGKSSLGKENGEVAIWVMAPCERSAKKIVHRTHEVYFDFGGQNVFE